MKDKEKNLDDFIKRNLELEEPEYEPDEVCSSRFSTVTARFVIGKGFDNS